MSARTPENPPPPDPRALLVVVDAARRATGSREDFANAAANHPGARDLDPQVLRRTVESYADAVAGFRPPAPTAGYVAAAFWALRRRVAYWLGLPALALATIAVAAWGIPAWQDQSDFNDQWERLNARMGFCRQRQTAVRVALRSLETAFERQASTAPNSLQIRDRILKVDDSLTRQESELAICAAVHPTSLREVRRSRTLVEGALGMTNSLLQELEETRKQLDLGPQLRATQEQLDKLLQKAKDLPMDNSLRRQIQTAHDLGMMAIQRSDDTQATEAAAELFGYLSRAREAADLPVRLDEVLASVRTLALDESVKSEAEAIRREADGADLLKSQEQLRRLVVMEGRLQEEYTLVMSGGKWRYKNNNPSNRSYYVLVEAVTPNGNKLPRLIKNEEDRNTSTVTIWGERVPFEVYERVRKDKQDDGVIQDNVFGRKLRGRMEEQVTVLSDEGAPLPRAGQITRW